MFGIFLMFNDGEEGYFVSVCNGRIQYDPDPRAPTCWSSSLYNASSVQRARAKAEFLQENFRDIRYFEIVEFD